MVIRGAASSSRLERSVYTAKALIENLYAASAAVGGGGIRFGAALGKGEAILAVPLTGDTEAVFALLNSLTSLTITSRGTNLEKLIDAAAGSFQDDFPSARYIILFSDGETLSGSVTAAVERLRQKRVKLFTAGAGSVYGAPVPETASPDGKQPLPVTSYPRIDVLTNAAERTGGVFVDASSDDAAQTIAGHIRSNSPLSGSESAWTLREESSGRWPLFVIAGLAAFILSRLCSLTLKKKPLGPA
jgi:Ca-activated chloride channel family protein